MKPIDLRNATWSEIQQTLSGRLESVWFAWLAHGPATTRQLAGLSGIDILNVRPRTTDLVSVGLVKLAGDCAGREGIYRARSQAEWEAWLKTQQSQPATQLQLL